MYRTAPQGFNKNNSKHGHVFNGDDLTHPDFAAEYFGCFLLNNRTIFKVM